MSETKTKVIITIIMYLIIGCTSGVERETKAYNIASAKTESNKEIAVGYVFRAPKTDPVKTIIINDEDHNVYYYDLRKK